MGRVKDELWSGEDLGIDSYDFADFSESETRELEQWLEFIDEQYKEEKRTENPSDTGDM